MGIPIIKPYHVPDECQLPRTQVSWRPDALRAALLIHDMQRYFIAPFTPGEPPLSDLLDNIGLLRELSGRLGMPVVYTAQPGRMTREQRGLLHDFWGPGMSTDEKDRSIVDELCPAEDDIVLRKWRYSAFHRTGLYDVLERLGRDQLIICGVYAHVGCLMTACDAFAFDIEPFLVADAVADFSAEEHQAALDYAARRCAVTASTQCIAEALLGGGVHRTGPDGRPPVA